MGVSFGDSRELVFLHPSSNQTFSFPQNNGDVFSFNNKVNKAFQHGVPKSTKLTGPRFSVIAWGRRRTLNEKNAGKEEVSVEQPLSSPNHVKAGSQLTHSNEQVMKNDEYDKGNKEVSKVDITEVTKLVENFVLEKQQQQQRQQQQQTISNKPKKSRVQGAYMQPTTNKSTKQGSFGKQKNAMNAKNEE